MSKTVTTTKRVNVRREARIKAGLTPEQVAKKARICVGYYKQIESRGRANPYLAESLSRILGCRMEYFIYYR